MSSEQKDDSQEIRLYNPYDFSGSPSNVDFYRLPKAPEFLFLEKRRSIGESMQYYAGSGYLAGAVLGGAKGVVDGIRARESGDTRKIRANRVINASGHTGRSLGNKMGVVGLLYAGMESAALYAQGGTENNLTPVIAGLGTGALYKVAGGPRTAAIAGALGGIAAGAIVAGRHVVKRYLPI